MPTKTKGKIDTSDMKRLPPLNINNAELIWRNFEGAAKTFNAKGLRNFHVKLDDQTAKQLQSDGWNVRWHEPKEEGDTAWASLKVAVGFEYYPPRILMLTTGNRKGTVLDADSVGLLDSVEIKKANLKITASPWKTATGSKGYKAWLSKMLVTLSDDDIEVEFVRSLSNQTDDVNED